MLQVLPTDFCTARNCLERHKSRTEQGVPNPVATYLLMAIKEDTSAKVITKIAWKHLEHENSIIKQSI